MSFFRRNKPEGRSPSDGRPLLYAQTPPQSSIASPQATKNPSHSRDDAGAHSADSKTDAVEHREVQEGEEEPTQLPFVRPNTPPQGSNYNAWSSYCDLPQDHPVFRYPDEMREKMYAKGVDPVVKAEMDLARLGKVYGENHHAKGFWKRGTSMMGRFGTMATGGSF